MYRKDSTGWIKHVDFIILDLICLQVAFVLAYVLSGYGANPYQLILYRNMAVFMEVADLVVLFAMGTLKNVLKRGYYKDFVVTAQHGVILGACLLLYLFMLQEGQQYSRLALILNIVIYILLTYLVRELWKHLLRKKMEDGENRSLLLVVSADVVSAVVESMKEHNYARYKIAGIAVIDKEMTGKYIDGVKVVANMENAAEYVCKEWIDEVLIVTSGVVPYPKELIEQFTETGVTVHLNLAKVQSVPGKKQFVEKVGDYTVLTTSINYASTRDLMLKRLMDIAGGLVGCLITGILFIFVAPAIYIASPGPIFFAQERVGKNGKRFKMYKFRSMYMDAEERKAELMKDNKLGDEKMFKLDFDPRVIGNKILPDGTHKTGIGDFIRRTSIDEFPQFFNLNVFGKDYAEIPYAHRDRIGCTVDYVSGRNRYVGYLISLGVYSFKGMKVGLDCANGSSWNIAKAVFDALGAKTYVINADPNGTNINTDAGSTHIEGLQKFVVEKGLDVGFAYDGDADRCLCVDEKGNVVDVVQIAIEPETPPAELVSDKDNSSMYLDNPHTIEIEARGLMIRMSNTVHPSLLKILMDALKEPLC